MNRLIAAIEHGKVRGFEEIKIINGERYYYQYALKKINGNYMTYLFFILESKMDSIENYGNEGIYTFDNLNDAFDYFNKIGINPAFFKGMRGTLPF
ncbi:hypothetical protein [uncultured Gilliamella sp.]|uniref:hypothetical protein n=1 Tax=uncultured Gilliamella sp. TaxID=1193505 RepID=UPI0025DCD3C4|nr:hypothetical protein [uncultured Gilliamella sp.]